MHVPSFSFHLHASSFHFALTFKLPFILLSCSFHLCSCPFIFFSYSFILSPMCIHVPFIFLSLLSPMCIHVLSSSFHLHACSFHFAFMSFHFQGYGNGSMAWPGDQVQQMVIAKLSLNNPSNIWHCLKEICHKNDRERERVRERERKRASQLDAKWYGNCRKEGTTG